MAEAQKRHRLTKQARTYLEGLFKTGTMYPGPAEKAKILIQIHEFPGNELYPKESLSRWFNQQRSSKYKNHVLSFKTERTTNTHNILYPTLTFSTMGQLNVLYKEYVENRKAQPPPGIITLWARVLRADVDHVQNWINERIALDESAETLIESEPLDGMRQSSSPTQSALDSQGNEARTRSQLPTPSQSTSPEPSVDHQGSTIKHEPLSSPPITRTPLLAVLPDAFDREGFKEHVRLLGSAGVAGTYPPSPVSPCFLEDLPAFVRRSTTTHPDPQITSVMAQNAVSHRSSLPFTVENQGGGSLIPRPRPPVIPQDLHSQLTKSFDPQDPATPVRSAAAFNELVLSHETKMHNFLNQVSKGAFLQDGWDPRHAKQPDDDALPTPMLTRPNADPSASRPPPTVTSFSIALFDCCVSCP